MRQHTAGPAANMVPFDRFPLLRPTHYGPRDVKVLRMAEKDIARLHPGQQAKVWKAIEDLKAGRATVEPKARPPLVGSYTVRVTNSLRLGLYLTEDQPGGDPAPDWVVYWVGDHNYAEAERRMMHNAGAYGPFPEDVTFGPAPSYEGHPRIHPDWPGIRVKVRGEYAGHLYWDPETHTIADVYVVPHWQRRGIATELLRRAREIDPYLRHSYELTPDGRAWAEKVAARGLPPGIEFEVHVATEDERYRQDLGGKVYARLPGRVTAEGDSPIVGRLVWRADGEIMSVYVAVDQQRQGIATEMLRRAREAVPYRIFHSDDLTPDGAAWAERVAKVAHTAALTVRTWDGRAGDPSHLTKEIRGTVPTSLIADLPGKRGEVPGVHRNKQGPEWEAFLEDIDSRGIQNAIFIVVEETGEAFIYEGNHRRDAAVELGLDEVPVEIRFFGKSEDIHPLGKIASQHVASDYWGGHRPTEEGPPVHDLLEGDSFAPPDIYENSHYYTGFARDPAGRESIEVIRSLRGQPGTVTIYRSAPSGVTSINTGDWVTLSRTYAEQHGYSNGDGPDWPVLSAQVPTEHVRWAGDDLVEWGYFGPPVNARTASLHTASSDYWGGHRPFEDGDPLHDLGSEGTFPQDVYDHPEWYSFDGYEREIGPILRAVRGKPDAMVTIYRALPPGAPRVINTGDWVTLSERYARQHAMKSDDPTEDWPVISAEVPASTVRSGGSDIIEWGYFGSPVNARTASLHTASSDIYAAEALLVPTLPRRSLRELKGLARRVLADEGYPAPHEVDIYADATVFGRASTQYTPEGAAAPEIALGLDMMNDLTLLHELAHVIEGGYPYMPVPDDHGPRWRAIYARLLSRYLPEAHSALAGVLGHRTASSGLTFTHHPDTIFDGQGLADASWGVDTLAAYDGGRLVGVISWYASGGLTDGGVDALWVHEDYRRRGIATELLARAKAIYPAVNPLNTPWFTDDGKAFVNSLPGIHIAETGLIGGRQSGDIDLIDNARWFHASTGRQWSGHTASLHTASSLTPSQVQHIEETRNYCISTGDINSTGGPSCGYTTEIIAEEDPTFTQVWGAIALPDGSRPEHVWLVMADGTIVDPTADQFGYEPIRVLRPGQPGYDAYLPGVEGDDLVHTASIGAYLKEWHVQETLRRQGHELMKPRTLATLQRKAEEVCAAGAAVLRPVVRLIPGPDSETHPPEPDGTVRIDISRENANLWSVLHECAHVLCYDRGMDDFDNFHGPGFREVFWGEVLAPYGITRDMTRTASSLTLEEVVLPLTALRTTLDAMTEVLESGRRSYTSGPILVTAVEGVPGLWEIADGHHRVAEAIREGRTEIEAVLDPIPDDEPYEPPFYDFSRHMTRTASSLSLEDYISVAENAVENSHPGAPRRPGTSSWRWWARTTPWPLHT